LKDANINSHVLIYPNYFEDPQDLRVMVRNIVQYEI
jgi:hypothetical protein